MKLKSVSEFMADDTTNPSSSNGDDKAGQLPFCSSAFRTSPSRSRIHCNLLIYFIAGPAGFHQYILKNKLQ
jgi:hypothetical protein